MSHYKGAINVAQDSRSRRYRFLPDLNGGCAPGLEQKQLDRPPHRRYIHGGVRRRCNMGVEDTGHMALKTTTPAKKQTVAIAANVFAGQMDKPTQKAVEAALGASYALWKQLISELKKELHLDGEDWHSSGVKYGWALRLQKKDRNILYLGPLRGRFLASFVLGDKAVAIARNSQLALPLLKMIGDAKRYGEGTPVRIEVSKAEDLDPIKLLAKIKVEN
jgi:hypothetical protein